MSFSLPHSPNVGDYLLFVRNQAGIGSLFLPDDSPWLQTSLDVATAFVNQDIQTASPTTYTLAVYNLATDRLINFALDQPGQLYFEGLRRAYAVNGAFTAGVVSSTSDSGTSASILNPEQMKLLTFQDLETLRTPWGRRYMGIAQAYGRSLWGLS